MAKSRHKSGSGTRGRYKRKRLNKGYSTIHKPHYLVVRPPAKKTAETEAESGAEASPKHG